MWGGFVYMVVAQCPYQIKWKISKENIELNITTYYIREMSAGQNICLFLQLKFGK